MKLTAVILANAISQLAKIDNVFLKSLKNESHKREDNKWIHICKIIFGRIVSNKNFTRYALQCRIYYKRHYDDISIAALNNDNNNMDLKDSFVSSENKSDCADIIRKPTCNDETDNSNMIHHLTNTVNDQNNFTENHGYTLLSYTKCNANTANNDLRNHYDGTRDDNILELSLKDKCIDMVAASYESGDQNLENDFNNSSQNSSIFWNDDENTEVNQKFGFNDVKKDIITENFIPLQKKI